MPRIIDGKSSLSIKEWKLIHSSRLDLLPLCGYQWSNSPTKTCRRCNDPENDENAFHVTDNCTVNLLGNTQRHNAILSIPEDLLKSIGHEARINKALPLPLFQTRLGDSNPRKQAHGWCDSHFWLPWQPGKWLSKQGREIPNLWKHSPIGGWFPWIMVPPQRRHQVVSWHLQLQMGTVPKTSTWKDHQINTRDPK